MKRKIAALCAAGLVSGLLPAADAAKPLHDVTYRDCLVQEMRGPIPARVFSNHMPPDWEPVPYGLDPRFATTGGTSLSCTYRSKEVRETWWWNAVVPPARYRDDRVEAYAFLLVAGATRSSRIGGTVRSCLGNWLGEATVDIEDVSASPRAIHTVTHHKRWGTDESYIEIDGETTTEANWWRFFLSFSDQPGYEERAPLYSFDVILDAEEAGSGRAVFGQNVADPSAGSDPGGVYVAAPGYFTGEGLVMEGAKVRIAALGPVSCARTRADG